MNAIPEELRGVTPFLVVSSVDAAVAFYRTVFGAEEMLRDTDSDGRVWHCELSLAGGRVLLAEEFPDMGVYAPARDAHRPVLLQVYLPDTDAVYAVAMEAGATGEIEPTDAFWGERHCQFTDPFGHLWGVSTRHAG
ncbi:MAG: VOC family protein [Mycobacteriales bacterium]